MHTGDVFTGQETDEKTGLIYFGARFYDPDSARFINQDSYLGESTTPPSLHRYLYAYSNPTVYIDKDGHIVETVWDVANIAMGVASLASNIRQGNYGSAALDAVGVVVDTAAAIVPFVPGGAGTAIKVGRGLDKANDARKAADAANDTRKIADKASDVDKAADTAKAADKANDAKHADATSDAARGKTDPSITKEKPQGPASGAPQKPNTADSAKNKPEVNQRANKDGCPCCFAGGTPVLTKDGLKPIEGIKEGELVASRNDKTGEIEWKPVTALFINDDDRITFALILVNDKGQEEKYEVTDNHPFNVEGLGWIDSSKLEVGMKVPSYNGGYLTVVSFTALNRSPITYNFEVKDFHTYFVGEQGAWVHNQCSCGMRGDENSRLTPGGVGRETAGGESLAERLKHNVDTYGNHRELVGGKNTGLDSHHVGQKDIMKDLVADYDPLTGPAILVPKKGHTIADLELPLGRQTVSRKKTNPNTGLPFQNARELIARDIRELRRVYPEIPNSKLKELIDLNKAKYPEMIKKSK